MTSKQLRSLRPLTLDETRAIAAYAAKHGRTWKADLREAWMTASEPGYLQALRNSHGPAWLNAFDLRTAPVALAVAPKQSYNFVQAFTRPDEGDARVYVSGCVVEATSREEAEQLVRERSRHLTVTDVRLAAVLSRDGVLVEYHPDGNVLTEATQAFALRTLGNDVPALFIGRAYAEEVLRNVATDQGLVVDLHPADVPYSDSSVSTAYPEGGDSFADAVVSLRRVY